jgi:hypothetical protein
MAANQDNQTNNMLQKRPAQDEEGAPASKIFHNAVTASAGGLGGALSLDALGCASQQFSDALAYTSSPSGGSPQSSAPANTVGATACAALKSDMSAPVLQERLEGRLKMKHDAAIAANTFEKVAGGQELFRCYCQAWDIDKSALDQNDEKNAWVEITEDFNTIELGPTMGMVIHPFIDPAGKTFKMGSCMMHGAAPTEPTIRDYDGCGVYDVPVGTSLTWQFDHVAQYSCGDKKVCFIVVKIPGTPPPTACNPDRKAKPEIQTSADVETLVRAKFFILPDTVLTMPCWFNASIMENERDMWKCAFLKMKRKRETVFYKYRDLMGDYSTLSQKYQDEMEQNIGLLGVNETIGKISCELIGSVRNDSQLTTTAMHDIKESMMCSICLDSRYEDKPAVVSSCGHVLHKECYEGRKPSMGDTCYTCMRKKQSWFPFTGYTGIDAALKELKTKRDAQ